MTDEIERFEPVDFGCYINQPDGRFVHYRDHLAAMRAKDARIAGYQDEIANLLDDRDQLRAEVERLRTRLKEIADHYTDTALAGHHMQAIARSALQRKAGE